MAKKTMAKTKTTDEVLTLPKQKNATENKPESVNEAGESAIIKNITIAEVPVAPIPDNCYISTRIDINLTREQSIAYRKIFNGLNGCGKRLANGKYVNNPPDAIRWLLEQIEIE